MATPLQCRHMPALPTMRATGVIGHSKCTSRHAVATIFQNRADNSYSGSAGCRPGKQAPAVEWRSKQQQQRGNRVQVTALGGPQRIFEAASIAPLLPRVMPILWRAATAGLGLFFALNWQTYHKWRVQAENEMNESIKRSEERKQRLKRFEPPASTEDDRKI